MTDVTPSDTQARAITDIRRWFEQGTTERFGWDRTKAGSDGHIPCSWQNGRRRI